MGFCPKLSYFVPALSELTDMPNGDVMDDTTKIGTARVHKGSVDTYGSFVHMNCIQNECELWDSRHNRCGIKVTDYNQGDGDGIIICSDDQCGGGGGPKASILISEFVGNEDLDGNGKICGVDFHITDEIPMLAAVPKEGTGMTMQEYLTDLNS